MAYWPSSASTGTKKPFQPLLRLEFYLLLFCLGETHRDSVLLLSLLSPAALLSTSNIFPDKSTAKRSKALNISAPVKKNPLSFEFMWLGDVSPHLRAVWFLIFLFVRHICTVAHNAHAEFNDPHESLKIFGSLRSLLPPSDLLQAGLRSSLTPILLPRLSSQHANLAVCTFSWALI